MPNKTMSWPRIAAVLIIAVAIVGLLINFTNTHRPDGSRVICLANERNLSSAISQYVQDSDGVYPWSFSVSKDAPQWGTLVDPYVKGDDPRRRIFRCPVSGTTGSAYSTNGQVIGLLDTVHKSPMFRYYNSVVSRSRVGDPGEVILLGEGILSTFVERHRPIHGRRSADEFAYPHPADVKDHSGDAGWDADWLGLTTNNHQISWRHGGVANFIFCDGHARAMKPGDLRDRNWDVRCTYGQTCEGSPKAPPYPGPDGSCGDQSPINCL